jgi:cysteinyl-tRNA synthetase
VSLDTDAAAAAAAGVSVAKTSSAKKGSNGGNGNEGPQLTAEEAAMCKDLMKRRDAARAVKNWPLADQVRRAKKQDELLLRWRITYPSV